MSISTAESNNSWWDSVMQSFTDQWWVFVVTLGVVLVMMFIVNILTKGRLFKFRTIIKVAINCILGFVVLFAINFVGGLFTGGTWAFTPKWFSWIIIGLFGLLGLIFLIVSCFVWPGVLVVA